MKIEWKAKQNYHAVETDPKAKNHRHREKSETPDAHTRSANKNISRIMETFTEYITQRKFSRDEPGPYTKT